MTKLGTGRSHLIDEIYNKTIEVLKGKNYNVLDATSITIGRDYLQKIVDIIIGVPLGIVILDKELPPSTLANCFYEMGWLDALGKETVIIKAPGSIIPSDLTRTEYIEYNDDFEDKFSGFMDSILEVADYYSEVGSLIERNPLLSIDYYRRAYLIKGDDDFKELVSKVVKEDMTAERAKNSVENLLSYFANNKK
jgi:hypothetical protein